MDINEIINNINRIYYDELDYDYVDGAYMHISRTKLDILDELYSHLDNETYIKIETILENQ